MDWQLTLSLMSDLYAVCRLPASAPLPAWGQQGGFVSLTRTGDELSVVCPQESVPDGVQAEADWRCLKVAGPFDLEGTIGVLAALATPLAAAQVSLFVVSTYDTDYLLLKDSHLERAIAALAAADHTVQRPAEPYDP